MPGSNSWMPYAPQGVNGLNDDDDDEEVFAIFGTHFIFFNKILLKNCHIQLKLKIICCSEQLLLVLP
jgi:hypothetical protein